MIGAKSAPWTPSESGGRKWAFNAALAFGAASTIAAAIVTNGNVIGTVAPILIVAVLAAIWVAPMRIPLMALIFFGLALDVAGEGLWSSPVAPLGRLLMRNLNETVPIKSLSLPLIGFALGYLFLIHVHRLVSASPIDAGRARPAIPMLRTLGVSLLTLAVLIALGVKRGGDIQMAKIQVQDFVLALGIAYLLAMSLRTKDYRVLGGLVLAAACIKSVMALWVFWTVEPTPVVAISHGDSLLFVGAAMIPIVLFFERPVAKNALLCLLVVPLILGGIVANNRRLAWAELAVSFIAFLIVTRRTPQKRVLARGGLLLAPFLVVYAAAGWDSDAAIFGPVKTLRSMTDADVDRSTLFRDTENFNLIFTMTTNPFLGAGLGTPYSELIKGDNISFFKEYRYMPHNSVLGLWAYGGMIGFTGVWLVVVVGIFMAARSYHWARSPDARIAAVTTLLLLLTYEMQCWGDIGFSEPKSILLLGSALGVASQLAVSTGAWGHHPTPATARKAQ